VSCAKTAKLMEMLWLGDSDGPKEACGGVHWRHLSNTIELSMCSGVVAFCQITLTTCYSAQKLMLIFAVQWPRVGPGVVNKW